MSYVPRMQPRPLSRAAQQRLHERREAEAQRSALLDEAIDLLKPYVFGELAGTPIPDDVRARFSALEAAAHAIVIPDYL